MSVKFMKIKLMMIVAISLVTLSGCTSDTRSMWHSRYAFKSVGQVMAMCDDGDRDACYAARDMGAMVSGLNAANANMQIQQQQQQQQVQQAPAVAMPTTTTCSESFDTLRCTTM